MSSSPTMILTARFDYSIFKISEYLPKDLAQEEVVLIPSAAYAQGEGNYEWVYPQDITPLKQIGIEYRVFDVTECTSEENVRDELSKARVLIVVGGDTFYLLRHMRNCNFEKVLKEKLEKGMLLLGASAMSAICGPDIDYIAPLEAPEKGHLEDFSGFGLIPFKIVPHLNHPHLAGAANIIMERGIKEDDYMIGLLDEQMVFIQGNSHRII